MCLLKCVLNREQHFSFFGPDYPTSGFPVTGLARVYYIAQRYNLGSRYRLMLKFSGRFMPRQLDRMMGGPKNRSGRVDEDRCRCRSRKPKDERELGNHLYSVAPSHHERMNGCVTNRSSS
jgi:hypothetical protein